MRSGCTVHDGVEEFENSGPAATIQGVGASSFEHRRLDELLDKYVKAGSRRLFSSEGQRHRPSDFHCLPRFDGFSVCRAHFIVACSDSGSVPSASHAVSSSNLNDLLDAKTREFVADPRNFGVDTTNKVVYVSKLFAWYGEDFTSDPEFDRRKPVEYLAPYVSADEAAFLRGADYRVVYTDWDGSLNEAS